jgi:hypothetical protein
MQAPPGDHNALSSAPQVLLPNLQQHATTIRHWHLIFSSICETESSLLHVMNPDAHAVIDGSEYLLFHLYITSNRFPTEKIEIRNATCSELQLINLGTILIDNHPLQSS